MLIIRTYVCRNMHTIYSISLYPYKNTSIRTCTYVPVVSMGKNTYFLNLIAIRRFHPLSTIVIHTLCMDDNCGKWVKSMGMANGHG